MRALSTNTFFVGSVAKARDASSAIRCCLCGYLTLPVLFTCISGVVRRTPVAEHPLAEWDRIKQKRGRTKQLSNGALATDDRGVLLEQQDVFSLLIGQRKYTRWLLLLVVDFWPRPTMVAQGELVRSHCLDCLDQEQEELC